MLNSLMHELNGLLMAVLWAVALLPAAQAASLPQMPSGPEGAGRFGAYYTTLSYDKEWDEPWRIGEHADVVVRFDTGGHKFVFWRGASYIPCWVTDTGIWYTNEFVERRGSDSPNTQGCCEPMSDKQCRYSHVRIIESTDARVVVHWRYAPVDVHYERPFIDRDTGWSDWVDEYYYIYPDAVGVRKITVRTSAPEEWMEWHEAIVLNQPGTMPEDNVELGALSVANMEGNSKTYIWNQNGAPEFDKNGDSVPATITEITGGYDEFTNLGVKLQFVVPIPEEPGPEAAAPENQISKKKASIPQYEFSDLVVENLEKLADSTEQSFERIATKDYPHYPYPFEEFNPVQSLVYPLKDNPNNMIIGASTSAGKTIAAELLIDSTLQRNKRVIYMSPLKTLTEEKFAEWKTRYSNETLMIMTGDYELSPATQEQLKVSNIIVMTSEMMDSRSRKFENERNDWMKEVGLVVVDEAHILTTDRGHAVETGIMRFTSHNPDARIVFLSATMPNLRELGNWLTSLNGKKTDIVQSTWRPVDLQMHYRNYRNATDKNGKFDYQATEFKKMEIAIGLVLAKPEEKFLVFVHSKNTGRLLLKQLMELNIDAEFHNADLNLKERRKIESSFKDREKGIRVLVSTSTNAWGVNLPARNVVIVGLHCGMRRVDMLHIIQMAGRAGRYEIDDEGHVFIILPAGQKGNFDSTFYNPRPVTSVLKDKKRLAFHILAEIYRNAIETKADIIKWYEKSLSYRQEPKKLTDRETDHILSELKRLNMINRDTSCLSATSSGNLSAIMYYPPYDIYDWFRNFKSIFKNKIESNDIALAWALATISSNKTDVPKDLRPLKYKWSKNLNELNLRFIPGTVLHLEAAHNCLTGKEGHCTINGIMRAFIADAPRMLTTLRIMDKTHAYWHRDSFWDSLEEKIRGDVSDNDEIISASSPQQDAGSDSNVDSMPDDNQLKDLALDYLFNIGYATGTWQDRKDVKLEKCPKCGAMAVIKGRRETEISAGTAYDIDKIQYCYKCDWRKKEEESYVDDYSDMQGPVEYEDEQERLRAKYGEGGFETDNGYFIPDSYDPS